MKATVSPQSKPMNDTSNLNAKTKRELSERERGIILDLAHGKTVKEIARALNISYQSVFQKLSHARAKMQATTTYHPCASKNNRGNARLAAPELAQ